MEIIYNNTIYVPYISDYVIKSTDNRLNIMELINIRLSVSMKLCEILNREFKEEVIDLLNLINDTDQTSRIIGYDNTEIDIKIKCYSDKFDNLKKIHDRIEEISKKYHPKDIEFIKSIAIENGIDLNI